jgi:glucosamine 6-phosphate synthetase-like amidotransferase/phosphosugar isomerase protein
VDKYNQAGLKFTSVVDTEMIPNTYTEEGVKEFTTKRKNVLDAIYGQSEVTPFEIKPRSTQHVPLD